MKAQKIFNNLTGSWILSRILLSHNGNLPSGKVTGSAKFIAISKNELLYSEEGQFITEEGRIYEIQQQYVYFYDGTNGKIKKYFCKSNAKKYLFYDIEVLVSPNENFTATSKHICNEDHYCASYLFSTDVFNKFTLRYQVKGPNKNYISESIFCRPGFNH